MKKKIDKLLKSRQDLMKQINELNKEIAKETELEYDRIHQKSEIVKANLKRVNPMILEFNRKNFLKPLVLNKTNKANITDEFDYQIHFRKGVHSDIIRIYNDGSRNFAIAYYFETDTVVLSSIKGDKLRKIELSSKEWHELFRAKRLKIFSVKEMIQIFIPKEKRETVKLSSRYDKFKFKENGKKKNFKTYTKAKNYLYTIMDYTSAYRLLESMKREKNPKRVDISKYLN